eukprot:CAMPEP_0182898128 /NCGR_PEP_ID=MMETSP0034_2-20130328/27308_1 /TAXON_ID=156128 /ORGANISM="Nephroselmis pyriformis, Strain CCMP717" /LENGTH=64 /DNA_ID=CAMNT_0025032085 /DNA_START=17 /DNA_END=211 /DNA_ORIENTATION=+
MLCHGLSMGVRRARRHRGKLAEREGGSPRPQFLIQARGNVGVVAPLPLLAPPLGPRRAARLRGG